MEIDKDEYYVLKTGKRFAVNGREIGIGIDQNCGLFDGYGEDVKSEFTSDEKKEIAQHFISLWMKYGNLTEVDL